MCGIAGEFIFGDGRCDAESLRAMRDTMTHRGPDGSGSWISTSGKVGLAHRRLAIIDLSEPASQPMGNEDGTVQLVFNGEIYNHAEIRKKLEKKGGHRWKTDHSDTEVIIHAYEEWGIDCIHKFRGMFAFALWDGNKQNLWLVRDRIGIKPLYYTVLKNKIRFASEIKAILADPACPRELDETAFYNYLSFLTTPAPNTLFKGINKLAGGLWLRINSKGDIREHRYWDPLDNSGTLRTASEGEVIEALREELQTSVRYRRISDVPVGLFLSGGIDSSTNVALFTENGTLPVKTFSIGYMGSNKSYPNELRYAKQVAGQFGADYHEKLLNSNDFVEYLPKMVNSQDEPIADPVCVPLYYVSKLARDNGVIVSHVGEGADELFMGYPRWRKIRNLDLANSYPVPRIIKKKLLTILGKFGKQNKYYYEILRRGSLGQPVFWGGAEGFSEMQKTALLSPSMLERFKGYTSYEIIRPIRERFEQKAWQIKPLQWMTYMDLHLRLPELLLMRLDKMSMSVSLECRVPFLDHKFVELAMSIPEEMKVRNGELKYIFKKVVRGLIPDEIIDRKKQGFGAPMKDWFDGEMGVRMQNDLMSFCDETDFFDKSEINRYFNTGFGHDLWPIINFAYWYRSFIDKKVTVG